MTMMIASEDTHGKIRIRASTNTQDKILRAGVDMYDVVLAGDTSCYKFTQTDKKHDLRVRVMPFSGDPDVYVHAGEKPYFLHMFDWNSRDHFENEELVLSVEERKDVLGESFHNTSDYYICTFAMEVSSYKLTVFNSDQPIYFTPGVSESSYLDTNETTTYYFRDPRMYYEDFDVKFTLHVMAGKARLRSKLCPLSKKNDTEKAILKGCTMTKEELLAEDPEEKL